MSNFGSYKCQCRMTSANEPHLWPQEEVYLRLQSNAINYHDDT